MVACRWGPLSLLLETQPVLLGEHDHPEEGDRQPKHKHNKTVKNQLKKQSILIMHCSYVL